MKIIYSDDPVIQELHEDPNIQELHTVADSVYWTNYNEVVFFYLWNKLQEEQQNTLRLSFSRNSLAIFKNACNHDLLNIASWTYDHLLHDNYKRGAVLNRVLNDCYFYDAVSCGKFLISKGADVEILDNLIVETESDTEDLTGINFRKYIKWLNSSKK